MDQKPWELSGDGRHAVVLGAGIAGLTTARVLASHFDRVTVVEQDHLADTPGPRVGTPQSYHVHVLLERGKRILEELFPGLQDDLRAAGAPLLNGPRDLAWLTPAGWGIRFNSSMEGHSASRGLLEWAVRRRVAGEPRVRFVEGYAAAGLAAGESGGRVTGLRVRPRRSADDQAGDEQTIPADFVVDATGRGSHAIAWLRALGYPEPETTEINPHLGYSTRLYRIPDDPRRAWQGLYVQSAPPTDLRGAVLLPLENGTWIATLSGTGGDYPPTDEEGFLAFARSVRTPLFYDAIRDAEPLTPIRATRSTVNIWHHFEKLARWPDRFVVLGDAACGFNPVYGQGMTVAVMEAQVLGRALAGRRDHGLDGLAQAIQKRVAGTIKPVWTIATGADRRVPGATGAKPNAADRFLDGYLDRLVALSTRDPYVRQALFDVLSLVKPTTALFQPGVIARAIRGPVRGADLPLGGVPTPAGAR